MHTLRELYGYNQKPKVFNKMIDDLVNYYGISYECFGRCVIRADFNDISQYYAVYATDKNGRHYMIRRNKQYKGE